MTRNKRSGRWLQSHAKDPYVKQARQAGYRSRAAYKLLEIDASDRLFKPGMTVLDVGAAPGGWSQVASQKVGAGGRVVAVDLLAMSPVARVEIVQGDFTDLDTRMRIKQMLPQDGVVLVISDISPNISGRREVDQANTLRLNESTLAYSKEVLRPGGDLVIKTFHGEGFDILRAQARRCFRQVTVRKPKASRAQSSEVYLIARGYQA